MNSDPIGAYAKSFSSNCAAIFQLLRVEIDAVLPHASSRIWHAMPVWFIDGNPVVGCNLTAKKQVNLLFWSGQSFNEPGLKAAGKFKAAQIQFTEVSQVDIALLRQWLKKAEAEICDYKGLRKDKQRNA